MRRGAAPLAGFTGWGSGAPPFRASAFSALSFSILPAHATLILCPHAPTRAHDFSRVPMGSHLTPIARV